MSLLLLFAGADFEPAEIVVAEPDAIVRMLPDDMVVRMWPDDTRVQILPDDGQVRL